MNIDERFKKAKDMKERLQALYELQNYFSRNEPAGLFPGDYEVLENFVGNLYNQVCEEAEELFKP